MKETDKYQNSSNNSEHLDDNELAQYAEYLRHEAGQIPGKLIDHVASCGYCRAELMAITDLLDTLPDVAEEPTNSVVGYPLSVAGRQRSAKLIWLRTTAAIAAIFFLAWIVQRLLPDRPMNEPVATNTVKDSTSIKDTLITNPLTTNSLTENSRTDNPSTKGAKLADTVRYAAAYIPNPAYENLVGAKYRSGSDPKVVGPNPGKVFAPGDTLKISWVPDPEDEYLLVILDNKANPVKEIKTGAEALLAWKIDLKPGLYYWKLLGKEEMWKVGKMKIIGSAARR
ncbi:MAG: hypothetical protein D4R64_00540 [Porphyromonadaceae bacterium]|nr:MAG: hypothetical protein D4R64_00540 [Porphyromonadaceae bacterium]